MPPGFVVLGFARRDWGDGDFESLAYEAAKNGARTPWREDVWQRLASDMKSALSVAVREIGLDELPDAFATLAEGRAKGRFVVRIQ